MSELALAIVSYQASLEHYRAAVTNDAPFIEQLKADLDKAREALEVAYARYEMRSM
jgi:hypothetical protein